jgi:hypothetical protein
MNKLKSCVKLNFLESAKQARGRFILILMYELCSLLKKGPGSSMSLVVGLPNNSYKPITNTAWRARVAQ